MGIRGTTRAHLRVWIYDHPGEDGGTWYAADYPLGATCYYRTPDARADAIAGYVRAIEATGAEVKVLSQ